jgi:hypothetical protein
VKDDPVQPIVDIIHGSVMKYDIATTEYGLKAITEKAIEVVHLDYEKEISEHFCANFMRIGKLAVSRDDDESTIKVLERLEFFGKSTAEKELEIATRGAARSLGNVGKAAVGKGLEGAARGAAKSLKESGAMTVAMEKPENATLVVVNSLRGCQKITYQNTWHSHIHTFVIKPGQKQHQ